MSRPVINVLYTPGTNSHRETLYAFNRVGGDARLLVLRDVLKGDTRLDSGDILCIPGGFSYGDHLGAGALAGQFLRGKLAEQLDAVSRRPLLAVCNGFQIAVRSGLFGSGVALAVNDAGTFRNIIRQRHLVEADTNAVWLDGLQGQTLQFPCAHGEGRFMYQNDDGWKVALRYPQGENPDGSTDNIGGISSVNGLVFGLMDHPERLPDEPGTMEIYANGVKAAVAA